jgi:hypothetical protein
MNDSPFVSVDHIQLAMPAGAEQTARNFFVGIMGMTEIAKPAALEARGGCWFRSGTVQIHLGIDKEFRPARKAHPALVYRDYDLLLDRLQRHGIAVRHDSALNVRRCYVDDPFGNRIELIAQE